MMLSILFFLSLTSSSQAFVQPYYTHQPRNRLLHVASSSNNFGLRLHMSASSAQTSSPSQAEEESERSSSILLELRDVAMKLHTKEQAPREGKAVAPMKAKIPYVPTQYDYLCFLVDSHEIYKTLEETINRNDMDEELGRFRGTGLERTFALERDIEWMCNTFNLVKPEVGAAGANYANQLRNMITVDKYGEKKGIPEFICHYYNYYFAHLAGGRMIGMQMSKLLLDGKTLEFYKWGQDINEIKVNVKSQIEALAKAWTRLERDQCISATSEAFRGGGAVNEYLMGTHTH